MICEATEYALKKIVDEIFSYVFSNINDLNKFFDECLSEIDKYKDDLRFVYQMAASPVYGTKIRDRGQEFDVIYDKYVKKLALQLQCNEHKLKPIVYLFISAVLDYVIWENTKNTQLQLMFIYSVLKK